MFCMYTLFPAKGSGERIIIVNSKFHFTMSKITLESHRNLSILYTRHMQTINTLNRMPFNIYIHSKMVANL